MLEKKDFTGAQVTPLPDMSKMMMKQDKRIITLTANQTVPMGPKTYHKKLPSRPEIKEGKILAQNIETTFKQMKTKSATEATKQAVDE